jgi:hypothetical protein
MNRYGYSISLRIDHPSMDPTELTNRLGLAPDSAWRVGDPRTTRRGVRLQGTRDRTFWAVRLVNGEPADPTLAVALARVVRDLGAHAELFGRLRADGGRAELFVGWFFDGNSGDELPAQLLADLGRLGLDLSFDVYPPSGDA